MGGWRKLPNIAPPPLGSLYHASPQPAILGIETESEPAIRPLVTGLHANPQRLGSGLAFRAIHETPETGDIANDFPESWGTANEYSMPAWRSLDFSKPLSNPIEARVQILARTSPKATPSKSKATNG